jgi:tetraacyldisaccharide 4'-kinase
MFQRFFLKVVRWVFAPFSIVYAFILSVRNLFFDKGIFVSTEFDVPVIAVGNLCMGGTGKTPQIEYLIRLLEKKHTIAVLSRGYKRKSKGFVLANENANVEMLGDEPYQFFKKFHNVKIAVDADRTRGINELLKRQGSINLILLDDAYQHRKVKANFYILLTSYDKRFTHDFVLPLGNLREARNGSKRANVIVVTKCPNGITEEERMSIIDEIQPRSYQKVFFSSIVYDSHITSGHKKIAIKDLKNYQVLLITGIAKPDPLLEYLNKESVFYKHLKFSDHHNFDVSDIVKIQNTYDSMVSSKKLILTTEKDFTRLSGTVKDLYALGIRSEIIDNDSFDHVIEKAIEMA